MALPDPAPHMIRFTRMEHGLDQGRAGKQIGVTQVQQSRYERGLRTFPPDKWADIEERRALGKRRADELRPSYILATCNDAMARQMRFDFIYDEHGRVGRFRDPVWADALAKALAPYGFPNPCAVPVWHSYIRSLLHDISPAPGFERDRVLLLDPPEEDDTGKAIRGADYVASVVRGLIGEKLAEAPV